MLEKIISGGQTGADQAGLDAAIDIGLPYGGYLPRGRRTEKGPLSVKYKGMTEIGTSDYRVRTGLNVDNSDGTVVFTYGHPKGGSSLTLRLALQKGKPTIHINLDKVHPNKAVDLLCIWIQNNRIKVLNVAGSRQSKAPTIHGIVYSILAAVIDRMTEG
jgi:hypothetical protein